MEQTPYLSSPTRGTAQVVAPLEAKAIELTLAAEVQKLQALYSMPVGGCERETSLRGGVFQGVELD